MHEKFVSFIKPASIHQATKINELRIIVLLYDNLSEKLVVPMTKP